MCGAGRVVCLIDPVGDVYACPFAIHDAFLAGNVRGAGGFAEVWRSSELFAGLRRPQSGGACTSCSAFDACQGGCMAAKFFTGLPLDGPDPECVRGFGEAALAAADSRGCAASVRRSLAPRRAARSGGSARRGPQPVPVSIGPRPEIVAACRTGPATRARWRVSHRRPRGNRMRAAGSATAAGSAAGDRGGVAVSAPRPSGRSPRPAGRCLAVDAGRDGRSRLSRIRWPARPIWRRRERGRAALPATKARSGRFTADVRDAAALAAAVAEAEPRWGGLDAAIACAGVIAGGAPQWEVPPANRSRPCSTSTWAAC